MKHVKLFEQFINEANYSITDFVEKYKGAKTLQPNESTKVSYLGVVSDLSGKEFGFIRKTDIVNIKNIEAISYDESALKDLYIPKKHWKTISKQGGLILMEIEGAGVVIRIIATPEWFETQSTIK